MSDTFRKQYKQLTEMQVAKCQSIKEKAQILLDEITADMDFSDQRCRALAITKLEECVMWAIKAIT